MVSIFSSNSVGGKSKHLCHSGGCAQWSAKPQNPLSIFQKIWEGSTSQNALKKTLCRNKCLSFVMWRCDYIFFGINSLDELNSEESGDYYCCVFKTWVFAVPCVTWCDGWWIKSSVIAYVIALSLWFMGPTQTSNQIFRGNSLIMTYVSSRVHTERDTASSSWKWVKNV